ncbi:MAG: hypothetical protein ABSG03_29100 [Bryobacteraceae bacterium]
MTAIGFGIAPAYVSSGAEPLTERGGTGTRQNRRLRGLLVAGEVALSVILVSGAGLFAKSLQRLRLVNPGFEAAPGLMFGIELPPARYRQAPQALQAFREIERRLRDLPQVKAVGLAKAAALQGAAYTADATVEGLVDERLAFGVDRGEVYQMALGIRGISGSDGFRDLFDRNGDRLARDTRFELHYRGLAVRSQPGNEQDTIFVGFLVFLKNGDRVLLGMIVDELVTLGAQQHQIADIVDIGRAECCVATRTVFLEGDDMRHLREVAGSQRQGML